jgi:cysteine desulfurase/selenocysteine lyase
MAAIKAYIGNPDVFPILRSWDFFNHAGVAPIPRPAAESLVTFARQAEFASYLNSSWYADIEKLRVSAATLLNCTKQEIAFVKNTSEGISIVANGIPWQFGDHIVTTAVEYPANVYPWMEVARTYGAKLVMVEEETDSDGRKQVPIDKILEAAADPKTRLVSLSHVEFASGQRHDLARIGEFCRANGKLFCVDAIQSLGILPVDVAAMKIDYLSADGHKWLLGPEGAGVFYCRKELLERTRPLMVGWMNVVNAQNFGSYDYTLRPDGGRFECGSYNVAGLLALKASMELLMELGTSAVSDRLKSIGDHLIERLLAKGYQIISPRRGELWSGIVSFRSSRFPHEALAAMLRREHRVEIAVRERRLRVSAHFYNTDAQIDKLLGLLPDH